MLLKRIEMQGFKSFADKTVLDFVNGATAVVGPNGSGKSNISDAIRWVIGETRAKSLRGSNMHDVIFAGTATRKPLNYAEVSLVLDNSTHIFPLDYEEIVVTRRLFRSGESVYQINRSNCLLKNIHELFMDTGLGRDGYSIIGQGNVSQILSTKAEDRRALFEEAAGVSKYKYRKDEAVRKLNHVDENLVRINDIVTEIETQINPLKRQSEKARKYLEFYGEYKTLDINLSLVSLDKNDNNKNKAQELFDSVSGELSELRGKESETEEKINNLYNANKEYDRLQSEKNNQLVENEAKVSATQNEITIAKNNISNSELMITRVDAEIKQLKSRNDERKTQIDELNATIAAKNEEAKVIVESFDKIQNDNGEINQREDEIKARLEASRESMVNALNNAASLREKISGIENLRSTYLERKTAVETEILGLKDGISKTLKEIEENKKEVAIKKEKHENISKTVAAHEEKAVNLKASIDDKNAELSNLNIDFNSKSSKKRILEDMENNYEGYARSVKAVLQSDELKRRSIYGTLSGLIDVKKDYVIAIETALGNALQNIVVENEEDAKEAINYLRRNSLGRATFLPISSVLGRDMENVSKIKECDGFIGMADELVSCNDKYREIVKNLLGRTVVVNHIDSAISMSKKFGYKFKIVTLDGDVANAGGSISGGSTKANSSFLSRAADIKSLTKEIRELKNEIDNLETELEKLNRDLKMEEDQLSSFVPVMRGYEDEILRLTSSIEHLDASVKDEGGFNLKENELIEIEAHLKESSEEVAILLSKARTEENEASRLKDTIEEDEAQLVKLDEEKELASKGIMDKTLEMASLENDIKAAANAITDAENEIKRAEDEILNREQDKKNIIEGIYELKKNIEAKSSEVLSISEVSEALRKDITELDEKKKSVSDTLEKIQSSNKDLTDRLLNLQQELSRAEARKERLDTERDNIINHLWEEYELTYSDAVNEKTEVEDEKEAFDRLSKLKAAIKALGSVNVDAIEEYKALKERFEFLSTQKSDLEKSKTNLNKIIESMEDLMREHFDSKFEEINKSFGEVFTELFGGGKGRLYLSDPTDVLESGIEIEVQLPGKGLQNLNLYSGGEKSFIAIALLFAILRVKPTPFCILDEIDAALDDVNVSRFATYLKNYVDNTQFILITHRRGSMEAANILYGVTMQEKGVSKLLSLHIDDVEDEMIG